MSLIIFILTVIVLMIVITLIVIALQSYWRSSATPTAEDSPPDVSEQVAHATEIVVTGTSGYGHVKFKVSAPTEVNQTWPFGVKVKMPAPVKGFYVSLFGLSITDPTTGITTSSINQIYNTTTFDDSSFTLAPTFPFTNGEIHVVAYISS